MQDLTPVGLSQDGRRLLLVGAGGEEFTVPVDTRLRAALRGENARLGQLEIRMESALRPRDIQARIRAGETSEDVAAAAQTTVEAIMVFAAPVLAERAYVASTAQRASVRRRSGESSSAGGTLGESAALFLGDHSLHDEDIEWDAWRRPDGRWVLVAAYAIDGRARTAEFTHDLPGRYVVAENDEARILIGELSESGVQSGAPAATGSAQAQARRLGSVPSQDELPLGDDAIELVRDRQPDASDVPELPDVPDVPREVTPEFEQAEQPDSWSAATAGTSDADWIASDVSTGASGAVEEPQEVSTDEISADEPLDAEEQAGEQAGEQTPADGLPAAEKSAPPKKRSRSSVPSWDEIMFGGKND